MTTSTNDPFEIGSLWFYTSDLKNYGSPIYKLVSFTLDQCTVEDTNNNHHYNETKANFRKYFTEYIGHRDIDLVRLKKELLYFKYHDKLEDVNEMLLKLDI